MPLTHILRNNSCDIRGKTMITAGKLVLSADTGRGAYTRISPGCTYIPNGRALRPECPRGHTGHVRAHRSHTHTRIPAAYTGWCVHARMSAAHAHTSRAYRPRTLAGVFPRTHRPCPRILVAYIGRCAHARPPAGVPSRTYQSGIRGHSGRCAHGAYGTRLCLSY